MSSLTSWLGAAAVEIWGETDASSVALAILRHCLFLLVRLTVACPPYSPPFPPPADSLCGMLSTHHLSQVCGHLLLPGLLVRWNAPTLRAVARCHEESAATKRIVEALAAELAEERRRTPRGRGGGVMPIYVHPSEGDDRNAGGEQDPVRTLGCALGLLNPRWQQRRRRGAVEAAGGAGGSGAREAEGRGQHHLELDAYVPDGPEPEPPHQATPIPRKPGRSPARSALSEGVYESSSSSSSYSSSSPLSSPLRGVGGARAASSPERRAVLQQSAAASPIATSAAVPRTSPLSSAPSGGRGGGSLRPPLRLGRVAAAASFRRMRGSLEMRGRVRHVRLDGPTLGIYRGGGGQPGAGQHPQEEPWRAAASDEPSARPLETWQIRGAQVEREDEFLEVVLASGRDVQLRAASIAECRQWQVAIEHNASL
jgi:hypothetical protein